MILAAALTALVTTASAASIPAASSMTPAVAAPQVTQSAVSLAGTSTLGAILPTPGAALLMTLGGLVMARGGRKAKKA